MLARRSLHITLPEDLAEMVRSKVESGEYASESDVINEGLRSLAVRDASLDDWLRDQVGPAYDRYKADPAVTVSLDDAMLRLRGRIAERWNEGR
ncbi:type II toxin-antitoxin system ParD family antitoxin [Rhizobium sp. CSW-27]|uniref:ribbon-helix-helix domain-containing protein n=1 Tax=Rhizobium sp. CSW-27 TaxID=2839985 RepID=UPI001C028DA4|nr:type II toxin-antitoxin system ParD family antitoxin [Rhizobium sp. CSW-27]MBT9369453.1 type II toxin-antitoxin system ParD family antitoxin [Rhizobium sp. CSW-27]